MGRPPPAGLLQVITHGSTSIWRGMPETEGSPCLRGLSARPSLAWGPLIAQAYPWAMNSGGGHWCFCRGVSGWIQKISKACAQSEATGSQQLWLLPMAHAGTISPGHSDYFFGAIHSSLLCPHLDPCATPGVTSLQVRTLAHNSLLMA